MESHEITRLLVVARILTMLSTIYIDQIYSIRNALYCHTKTYTHRYIYIYMCVCVCVYIYTSSILSPGTSPIWVPVDSWSDTYHGREVSLSGNVILCKQRAPPQNNENDQNWQPSSPIIDSTHTYEKFTCQLDVWTDKIIFDQFRKNTYLVFNYMSLIKMNYWILSELAFCPQISHVT